MKTSSLLICCIQATWELGCCCRYQSCDHLGPITATVLIFRHFY